MLSSFRTLDGIKRAVVLCWGRLYFEKTVLYLASLLSNVVQLEVEKNRQCRSSSEMGTSFLCKFVQLDIVLRAVRVNTRGRRTIVTEVTNEPKYNWELDWTQAEWEQHKV